ncbi:glycosyl hydrolase family 8 [Novosphingobium pokkalii]|uniref:glycosyl hydrolase family 8 n=1 Tax=Novosphingobium pokkalii TaxID=1770194 RepID=UPI00363E1C54
MVLALEAEDRATFELIADWTNDNLLRSDVALHAWKYDPSSPDRVPDRNNATDGDILIAWALERAGRQWGGANGAPVRPRSVRRSASGWWSIALA